MEQSAQLSEANCPHCGGPVQRIQEEAEAEAIAQRNQNNEAGRIEHLLADVRARITPQQLWDIVWSSSSVSEDGLVSPVDPSDMKAVLRMGREWPMGRERHIAQAVGSTGRGPVAAAFGSVCSPDADVTAAWYRVVMLGMCDEAGLLSAHKHSGEFTDAVFQVAARFPMKRMEADATYDGPPFDTEEFVKQIERASAE
jgi:hypothetical protein